METKKIIAGVLGLVFLGATVFTISWAWKKGQSDKK